VAARRTIDPRMHAFATGIGAGNYQFSIGSYYARLPNEEKMPPGSNNLYLVLADDIGILGLASLLWMLGYFFKRALEATRLNRNDWLGAGVIGLLVSFLFVNNFHALIVRGIGLVLVFAFSLAIVAKMQAEAMLKESET
jgi:O-antigen ligase